MKLKVLSTWGFPRYHESRKIESCIDESTFSDKFIFSFDNNRNSKKNLPFVCKACIFHSFVERVVDEKEDEPVGDLIMDQVLEEPIVEQDQQEHRTLICCWEIGKMTLLKRLSSHALGILIV